MTDVEKIASSLQDTYGPDWMPKDMADMMADDIFHRKLNKTNPRRGSYFEEVFLYIWSMMPGGGTAKNIFIALNRDNEIEDC